MDFKLTRSENDEALLPQIDSIRSAEKLEVLIPFAKAYLGMFYVIDKALTEKEKVKLLANDTLAEALFAGFLSSLNTEKLPSIVNIGKAQSEQVEFAEGYVVLAGLDLIAKKSFSEIQALDPTIIEAAIGFHFSNKSGYHNIWFNDLLEKETENVAQILSKYWVAMLKNNAKYLPGRNLILGDASNVEISRCCVLPVLKYWKSCKAKVLLQLLHIAFKHSDTNDFLAVCEEALENDKELNERTRLYWIASTYLLSPDKNSTLLSSHVGRAKLKIMPLLDFAVLILKDKDNIKIDFNSKMVVQLLRLIAPIFPPQHHVYGAIGALDINSKNVMLLFFDLLYSNDKNIEKDIKSLKKARVMKIYSAVIENILELRKRKKNSENFSLPNFNEYIKLLIENKSLQGRSNKFDLR